MSKLLDRLASRLRKTQEVEAPKMVQMGTVEMGGSTFLCSPDARLRGVKLVMVGEDFIRRYNVAVIEWNDVQDLIKTLPTSLRPRRPSVRKPATTTNQVSEE